MNRISNNKTINLVNSFMDHAPLDGLELVMFNIHLYNDFIEVSVAEEHDLGRWIDSTQSFGLRFSDELHSYEDICRYSNEIKHLYLEFLEFYTS